MPQTTEPFEILKLMDINKRFIALTKTDLVDKDWLELVEDDIKKRVKSASPDQPARDRIKI